MRDHEITGDEITGYLQTQEYGGKVAEPDEHGASGSGPTDYGITRIQGVPESGTTPPWLDRLEVAVIPAYNEERFIASVVLRTSEHAAAVIVVDDGSSDATARLAERSAATVIRQPKNRGKAQALHGGFRAAIDRGADTIACLDADAQHDNAEIPLVTAPIFDGKADLVIGTRFHCSKRNLPWSQVGQHTLTAVTNTLSGVRVTDSQSGFRAFSVKAAKALKVRSGGLSVESEMQFLFEAAGLNVFEVPISVQYRDGNKQNPVVHGIQVLEAMLSLVARRRPLMFFSLPGAVLATAGGVMGLFVTARVEQGGELFMGTALLTVLLLLVGTLPAVTDVVLHSIEHLFGRLRTEILEEFGERVLPQT